MKESISRKAKKVPNKAIILIGSNQHHNQSFTNKLTTERVLLSKIEKQRQTAFNKSEQVQSKILKVHPSHNILGNNEELFVISTSTLTQDNYITIITQEMNKIMREGNYCIIGVVFIADVAQIKDATQSQSQMKVFFQLMKLKMPTLIDLLLFINVLQNGQKMERVQQQNKEIRDLLKVFDKISFQNVIGWFDATDTEMGYVQQKIDDKFESQWRELSGSLSKQNKLSYSKFEYIYDFEVFWRKVEEIVINLVSNQKNFEQFQTFQCNFELHKKQNKTSKVFNQQFNKNDQIFSQILSGCKNGAIFGVKCGATFGTGAGIGISYLFFTFFNHVDAYAFMIFSSFMCTCGAIIGGLAGTCTGSILSFIEAFFGVQLEEFYETILQSVVAIAVGVMSGCMFALFDQNDKSFQFGAKVGALGGAMAGVVSSILNFFVKKPKEQKMQIKFEQKKSFEGLLNKTFMKKISSKIEVVDRTFSRKLTIKNIPDWLDKLTIIMEGQQPQQVNVSNGYSSAIKLTKKTANGRIEFRVLTPKIQTIVSHLQRAQNLLLKLQI